MIIKIVIIGAILVGGTVLIYPNLLDLQKDDHVISANINNLNDLKNDAVNTLDTTIDNTVNKVESTIEKINPTKFKLKE